MTSTNSTLLFVILSLVSTMLFAALGFGVYHIRAQNQETSELLHIADQAAETENLIQSIRMIQSSKTDDILAFDSFIISSDRLVYLIEEIEGAGRALDIDLNILAVDKIENKKTNEQPTLRITIETRGAWGRTHSFIQAMENLPYKVMVDESTLNKDEADWRSRLVISLYLFD